MLEVVTGVVTDEGGKDGHRVAANHAYGAPLAAAVVSEDRVTARNTPCSQLSGLGHQRNGGLATATQNDGAQRHTSGRSTRERAYPPGMRGVQKRSSGETAGGPDSGVQSLPVQSIRCAGTLSVVLPPDGVRCRSVQRW